MSEKKQSDITSDTSLIRRTRPHDTLNWKRSMVRSCNGDDSDSDDDVDRNDNDS